MWLDHTLPVSGQLRVSQTQTPLFACPRLLSLSFLFSSLLFSSLRLSSHTKTIEVDLSNREGASRRMFFVCVFCVPCAWHVSTMRPEINSNDFGRFLELISRFEFEFRRRENYFFLNDSNFWCVHVNVPWPFCAHAIPFRMLWFP